MRTFNMITEDYVNFETAKLLKEKGFNEDIARVVSEEGEINYLGSLQPDLSYRYHTWYKCPTLQMAMKWLREMHKLCISITPQVTDDDGDGGCLWQFAITSHLEPLSISLELYEQYEEACESAIKYALENLI